MTAGCGVSKDELLTYGLNPRHFERLPDGTYFIPIPSQAWEILTHQMQGRSHD